jgi:hypothetical protein
MTAPTRRAALGALAGVPALTLPAVAHAELGGSLATLGAEFEETWAAEKAADDDAVEAANDRARAIVQAIETTRATSLADFRVKARALLWCYSGDYEEMIGVLFGPANASIATRGDAVTTDIRLLRSIVEDLLAPRPQTGGAAKA